MTNNKKEILLINPNQKIAYLGSKVETTIPNWLPLNLLNIARPLLDAGYRVTLVDLNYDTMEDLRKALLKKPFVVGITSTTALFEETKKVISIVKGYDKNIKVVIGGVHASVFPEIVSEIADVVVVGEGDYALLDIIQKDFIGVYTGKPIPAELIPKPAYGLINPKRYVLPAPISLKNPAVPLETSRGCPYECIYCTKSIWGNKFRAKSVERVFEDFVDAKNAGFKEVMLIDDGFNIDKKRAKEMCQKLIDNEVNIVWATNNGIRVDSIDEELIALMGKAGCYRVTFGVESGSQKILDQIKKGVDKDTIRKAFKICKEKNMEVQGLFMFGLPDETIEDMNETVSFINELKPDLVRISIMNPLPKTPIWEEWKNNLSNNTGLFYNEKNYYHPTLSFNEVNDMVKKTYKEYYLNPNYLLNHVLKRIKKRQFSWLIQEIKTGLQNQIWK